MEAEAPAEITVLESTRIAEQPGVNLDDRLRSVPGFSLFRRSSSLVANPTTQGVSLRGLGSSGASRSLVLWDGIPINDPFGGWVYWTRIPVDELERVEISRGASTSLFGDRAMSGAIALFSRPAEPRRISLSFDGGNHGTSDARVAGSHVWRQFAFSAAARALGTEGYYIVPEAVRGPVDRPAAVHAVSGYARIDYLGTNDRVFLKFDTLAEDRDNGTLLTHNSTGLGNLAGQYTHAWTNSTVSVLGYHTREQYHSSFSAVSAGRSIERITYNQTVPSSASGAAGLWRYHARRFNVVAGEDMQRVQGTSTDRLVPSGLRVGGGSQFQHGTFAQGDTTLGAVQFFAGLRHQFTGRGETFVSPSAGVVAGRGIVRARGSVYRSFRAPTLNELYREFRVGNTITQANAGLKPEALFGAEVGVDLVGERTRASVTLYRNALSDVITNVTLSATGNTIVRQRQNAQDALVRGVDTELRRRFGPVDAVIGYVLADSRVASGQRIPQVPRHQGNAQLSYVHKGTLISGGVRSYSSQFEDDLNRFLLPGFASVQLVAQQALTRGLSARVAVENLLDREYLVGFSPTPLIGQPRLWRVGLRWN